MKYCSDCGNPIDLRIPAGDTLPRHVCPACGTIHYQNPKMVVGCIPEWEDKILLCRGSDVVDLILLDNNLWGFFMSSLQNIQRFPGSSKMAELGFVASKYMNADVVLDGGIGGNIPTSTGYFLNTKYIFFRPHQNRNFVPIGDERMSTNQDAIVRLIGWAGNMTASGLQFQGIMTE